jgi:hypothetical protein
MNGGLGSNEGGVGEGHKWKGLIQFSHLSLGRIINIIELIT